MTPFKQAMHESNTNTNTNEFSSEMNTSMDEGSSMCSESIMLSSPPRAPQGRNGARNRLFADDEEEAPLKPPSILKPLDLNLELGGLPEGRGSTLASTKSRTPHRKASSRLTERKRHAEHTLIGRDLSFDDVDDSSPHHRSPVDMMMQSPRISPSCYRSPSSSLYRGVSATSSAASISLHKSPCYRTMDGRTVQSKNPFSPMYTEDSAALATSTSRSRGAAPILSDALTFPVSLEDKSTSIGSAPLLRHRLQKRDSKLDPSTFRSVAASSGVPTVCTSFSDCFTRDGYPERQGRYSFTGSPIKEMDCVHAATEQASNHFEEGTLQQEQYYGVSHKVRRRSKMDDAAVASSHVEAPSHSSANTMSSTSKTTAQMLHVKTQPDDGMSKSDYYRRSDEVSPTDVFSFPMSPPGSPSTPVPPTPTKPRHYRRHPTTRYTPVRKSSVPPTPMPERRVRTKSFDEDLPEAGADNNNINRKPQSRFHADFDIIGELGNGSFGNVFKVLSRLDGCMYAIKVAHRPAKGQADKDRMLKEVYALAALSDQADTATFHIVRYHQAWMEEHRLYIQTELCSSTLSEEVTRHAPLLPSVERRYKFLREICLALEFIHKNGMVHLDIKPENIFVKNDQFKLGDFGLVSTISSHDVEEGDSRYMSMELLSGEHADLTKSDIFSLGITLYEMCLGGNRRLPTNGPEWQSLRAANFEALAQTPAEMHRLIKLMMNPNAAGRPSASDLLKRPQLLSQEQKMLLAERNKVVQANLALVAQANRWKQQQQQQQLPPPTMPPRKGLLVRANTWNGS